MLLHDCSGLRLVDAISREEGSFRDSSRTSRHAVFLGVTALGLGDLRQTPLGTMLEVARQPPADERDASGRNTSGCAD